MFSLLFGCEGKHCIVFSNSCQIILLENALQTRILLMLDPHQDRALSEMRAGNTVERRLHLPVSCLFVFLLSAAFLLAQDKDTSLNGVIRDPSGAPIANASVLLRYKSSPSARTSTSDVLGHYSFSGLNAGNLSLHVTKEGYRDADISFAIRAHATETRNLVLEPNPTAATTPAPQFFDHPQFTVSGVVDTTALGGHGSDTVVRTRESIAKDTVTLVAPETSSPGTTPEIANSIKAGDFAQARDQVRSLISTADKPELHHLLADLDEKLGDSLEAVQQYQRAAQMQPTESYIFDWGSELLLHHAPEPASEVFQKGRELFPDSIRMRIGLGASSFARGSIDDAIQQIGQASELDPLNSTPYLFLGKILSIDNAPSPELVDRLHRFVTVQPQNAEANYYYAVALWKQKRAAPDRVADTRIESFLANAIRLDPKFAPAQLQLGILKAEKGDYAGAIPHYARAIDINPQFEEAHYRLAQAYRRTGETDKAKDELHKYDELSKKSAQQVDRDRREIRQFVYTLRDQKPPQTP